MVQEKETIKKATGGVTTKKGICSTCDVHCSVKVTVKDGRVIKVSQSDNPLFKGHICMKGVYAPKGYAHPDRIKYPLKRVGERGSGKWERVTWDEAMTDITTRLKKVVAEYGAEAVGASTSTWNTSTDMGLGRRFMNNLGSPNWTSGVAGIHSQISYQLIVSFYLGIIREDTAGYPYINT